MGKKDVAEKLYTENNRIFADIVNYILYDGAEIVGPEHLKEVSGEELFLEEETDIDLFVESVTSADSMDLQVGNGRNTGKNIKRRRQKDYIVQQRYRDVSKQITIRQGQDAVYMLISLENQSEVHYAMPVRNMLNDSMRYMKQVNQIRSYRKGRQSPDRRDFLSGIDSRDKLLPVITIVILFQNRPWDGPRSLHEMLDIKDPAVLKYVQDYKIHVIAPAELSTEELKQFHSSMREVLNFIKYSEDEEKLRQILQEDADRFNRMEQEAVQLLNLVTGAEIEINTEQEVVDMCKALADMISRERKLGYDSGIEEGREEGQREKSIQIIKRMLAHGYTHADIMEIIGCDSEELLAVARETGEY